MRRNKLNRKKSRRIFKNGAKRIHRKNMPRSVMRGGTRL